MLEYATYSVISPEGCASILWRDDGKKPEAAAAMKMTATDLQRLGVVDEVIPEAPGGAHRDHDASAAQPGRGAAPPPGGAATAMSPEELRADRYKKFRHMGAFVESGDKADVTGVSGGAGLVQRGAARERPLRRGGGDRLGPVPVGGAGVARRAGRPARVHGRSAGRRGAGRRVHRRSDREPARRDRPGDLPARRRARSAPGSASPNASAGRTPTIRSWPRRFIPTTARRRDARRHARRRAPGAVHPAHARSDAAAGARVARRPAARPRSPPTSRRANFANVTGARPRQRSTPCWPTSGGTATPATRGCARREGMLRLHDNAASGNAYKVRLLLTQLGIAVRTDRIRHRPRRDAHARVPARKNPNGRIPVLELEDGRCLPESNAILWYLAEGTPYLPARRRAGAGSARRCCSGCSSSSTATSRTSRPSALWITHNVEMTPRSRGCAARQAQGGRRRARRDGAALRDARLLRRRRATRSPTSRSTRTRTSRTKAASTSRPSPPCAPGWRASRISRGTSGSQTSGGPGGPDGQPDRDFSVAVGRRTRGRRLWTDRVRARGSPTGNVINRAGGTPVATPAGRCGGGLSSFVPRSAFLSRRWPRVAAMTSRRTHRRTRCRPRARSARPARSARSRAPGSPATAPTACRRSRRASTCRRT